MACYKQIEIERIRFARPKYVGGITFAQSGIEEKDFNSLNTFLRRFCERFEGISYVLVSSSTKSKDCRFNIIRTQKAGRPKKVVIGQKCRPHVHCLIISQNANIGSKQLRSFINPYLVKRCKKRPNIKQHKIKNAWLDALPIYPYMLKQADSIRRYGDFDFDYYDKYSMFLIHEEDSNYFNISDCRNGSETHITQVVSKNEPMNVLIYSKQENLELTS